MKFSFKQALSNDKHTYKKVGRGLSMDRLPLLLLQSLLTVVPSIAGNSVRLTVRPANKSLNNQLPCIHTHSRHRCSTPQISRDWISSFTHSSGIKTTQHEERP
jgi:hypothetical protein